MATLFTHRLALPTFTLLSAGLGTYTALSLHHNPNSTPLTFGLTRAHFLPTPLYADSLLSSFIPYTFRKRAAPAPPPTDYRGFSPVVYRQTATGSFLGVALGLLVSKFGKTIAFVIAALLVGVEVLARNGVDVVDWTAVGRVLGGVVEVDRVKKWAGENLAFK